MYLYSLRINSEAKNENQLKLAYKEYDNFLDVYSKFELFYKFEINDSKLFSIINFDKTQYA